MKSQYTYKTEIDPRGNVLRYKCWAENFKDEDTGAIIPILRHRLIKVNGQPVEFYSISELKSMSSKQKKDIQIDLK